MFTQMVLFRNKVSDLIVCSNPRTENILGKTSLSDAGISKIGLAPHILGRYWLSDALKNNAVILPVRVDCMYSYRDWDIQLQ